MKSEGLDKVNELNINSTEPELFDAIDALAKVHIESRKYDDAWRKAETIIQWKQHKQALEANQQMVEVSQELVKTNRWLTYFTGGLFFATLILVVVTWYLQSGC